VVGLGELLLADQRPDVEGVVAAVADVTMTAIIGMTCAVLPLSQNHRSLFAPNRWVRGWPEA
jgi:hypothetical protein